MNTRSFSLFASVFIPALLIACGGGSSSSSDDTSEPPIQPAPTATSYKFENASGESTVSYTGQTRRQILIADLTTYMERLEEQDSTSPGALSKAGIISDLNNFFRLESGDLFEVQSSLFPLLDLPIRVADGAPSSTFAYSEVGEGKYLAEKIAGEDSESHLPQAGFLGLPEGFPAEEFATTPAGLVDYWFDLLAEKATDAALEEITTRDDGTVALEDNVTVTATGLDLRQLIQKFLVGAINFSQGTTDYLSIDFNSEANRSLEDGKNYTSGQHDFDEAFGYFGAARNYNDYSDDEIRNIGYKDSDDDGVIDLRSEYNFAHSTNCAKRDAGAVSGINLTKEVFDAFLAGRAILQTADSDNPLSDEQRTALDEQIEIAALSWEKCIAATVIHYINVSIADLLAIDAETNLFVNKAAFLDYAKHWSEMKGFALNLQFSRFSPFSPFDRNNSDYTIADLEDVLQKMGDAPVLADGTQNGELDQSKTPAESRTDYISGLESARDVLEDAYNFDPMDVANW